MKNAGPSILNQFGGVHFHPADPVGDGDEINLAPANDIIVYYITWTIVEPCWSIICAALPSLLPAFEGRNIFKRLFNKIKGLFTREAQSSVAPLEEKVEGSIIARTDEMVRRHEEMEDREEMLRCEEMDRRQEILERLHPAGIHTPPVWNFNDLEDRIMPVEDRPHLSNREAYEVALMEKCLLSMQ